MSNTMKSKFGKFLQELFSRGVAIFSKNIRQDLNLEVPTKFYQKERPHDLWWS